MGVNADELRKIYLNWVKENFYKDLNSDWIEIKTPFTDLTGSYIYLYAKKNNDKIIITDYGNTMNEFELNKIELKGQRKNYFDNILLTQGCKFGTQLKDIYIEFSDVLKFPIYKHQLIQAIININDLYLISKNNVKNMFINDIIEYLDNKNISYSDRGYSISGVSGLPNKFDLNIGKIKKRNLPQVHTKVINKLDTNTVKLLLFTKGDVILNNDERIATIINSKNKVNKENLNALKSKDIDVIESNNINDYFMKYSLT